MSAQQSSGQQAVLVRLSDTHLTLARDDEDVRGRKTVDRNGEEIGEVDDLIIDPEERRVRFIQVAAGGFLGMGEDKRLVPVDAVTGIDDQVHIDRDRASVAGAPGYDPDLVLEQPMDYYEELYGYYGYPPFWMPGHVYPPFPFGR